MRREDFTILSEKVYNKPLVYLDNAATTQKPKVVVDAITEAYNHCNANIHRGVHYLSQQATLRHEEARQKVAQFLGAADSSEIIFTKGTTDSINMLARCFGDLKKDGKLYIGKGDEIIVSEVEHHSNIVPWQMLCERNECTLRVWHRDEPLPLSEHTKIISIAHVSNVLGTMNPIEEIIREAHDKQVPVIIDAAQSAAHTLINVQQLDCDFLVCSAHKMYGPTGLGILYGKKEWLNTLPPAEGGGEMIEHVSWEKTTYNTLPYKFEAGTPNYIGSHAFGVALDYICQIGRGEIEQHEKELCKYAEEQLLALGVKIYDEGKRKYGAISFNVYTADGRLIHPFDVGTLLDRQGVAVRTGHHCAEPLIDQLGVPGTVRISFGLYNDKEDVDAFIQALTRAIAMLS